MESKIELKVTDKKIGKEILKIALENRLKAVEISILRTKKQLQSFEKKYEMDSSVFYKKFNSGELDELDDFIDWAGEYEIFMELKKEEKIIKEMLAECK